MNNEKTRKEFKTTKSRVLRLLETDEACRNSDKILTYRVFKEIANENGKGLFIPWELWDEFPAFETIKRVRAQIQNKYKRFPPTDPDVIANRRRRRQTIEKIYREDAL